MAETTKTPVRAERAGEAPVAAAEPRGAGWMAFAATMLFIAGVVNVVYGILAIDQSSFFVADERYTLSDLNTWGWIMLVVGVVQLCAGLGVLARNQAARFVGVGIAGLSAIAQLLWLPASPLAALAILAIDVLVMYGLLAYGGRHRAAL